MVGINTVQKGTVGVNVDELAEIAENERQTLLKKAKETAAENDGGDIL